MFPSAKHIPPPTIKMYRGNTSTIVFNKLQYNGNDKPTVLSNESILFIVKSTLGTTVLSKTIVGIEGKEIPICFHLFPDDTVDLCSPFKYEYSVSLYKKDSEDFYTLERGIFILKNPVGSIRDMQK